MLLRNYVEFACTKPTTAVVFVKFAEQLKTTISAFPTALARHPAATALSLLKAG